MSVKIRNELDNIVKQKSAEIERLKLQLKATDQMVDQERAQVEQY